MSKKIVLVLFLFLVLFSSVFGAELENMWGITLVMLFFALIVAIVPVIVVFPRLVPTRFLPLTIFVVSLSLLLHQALISNHLWGADINTEFYYYEQVITHHYWNSTALNPVVQDSQAYSATTSITVFPALISIVTGISGISVFKVIFPLLYSLVPLILYRAYEAPLGPRSAFMAAFFFAAIPSFYEVDLSLGKQMIATLFVSLFMLVAIGAMKGNRLPLLLLFGVGTLMSHYSTGLFLIALLVLVAPVAWIKHKSSELPLTLAVSLVAFYLVWYVVNSSGFIVGFLAASVDAIYSGLRFLLVPDTRYSLVLISQGGLTPADQVIRALNLIFQAFIFFGVIDYVLVRRKARSSTFRWAFTALALASFGFLALSIGLPYFSSYFDVTRLYTLSLLFLAPFGVVGASAVGRVVAGALGLKADSATPVRFLGIFAVMFLLFNIGFVSAVANEPYPSAFSLIPNSPYSVYGQGEFSGGLWLVKYVVPNTTAYMDPNSAPLFAGLAYLKPLNVPWPVENSTDVAQPGSVFFINTWNLRTNSFQLGIGIAANSVLTTYDVNITQHFGELITHADRIYDDSLSTTLFSV